jgi:hypothetical protein
MMTKHEWNAALDAWVTAERERLGGPPTPEEVVAYTRGTLVGEEAARVRALLVYYPELTPLLEENAPPAPRSFRHLLPIAAGLIIALLGVLLIESRRELARTNEPYVHESRHELRTSRTRGVRGAGLPAYELPAGEERYVLALSAAGMRANHAYRIEIVDASSSAIVWSKAGVRPIDGAFEIAVPREFLREGVYRVNVWDDEHAVESVSIRVTPQTQTNRVEEVDP